MEHLPPYPDPLTESGYSTAKAEQTYFAIRGGKAKRVDAASVVEAASVCGGKSHFAAKLRICPLRHAVILFTFPISSSAGVASLRTRLAMWKL
ncbi:hypothetical protein DPMN_155231 [Dreissena polymorpha]|uniref:Uncharacterized protein n=1 Tax=Dreissena polymorpha TaxID=45954 RepID=A0A9D4J6G5_DREPO|nr:hypothetical protein DPMN_155231 [Dreissena polymorpha]